MVLDEQRTVAGSRSIAAGRLDGEVVGFRFDLVQLLGGLEEMMSLAVVALDGECRPLDRRTEVASELNVGDQRSVGVTEKRTSTLFDLRFAAARER